MAQAHVVYTNVSKGVTLNGSLFQGKKFWLSRTVPQRAHISEQITTNGGELVDKEEQADIKIMDHARKHAPPGTYSFKYVTESVRNGKLEDLENHLAGPPEGTIRNVGSARPTKGTRTLFTKEDDEVLLNWVKEIERKGGKILGNEIYKQLETMNPRHTFQSWRDRYLKYLRNRPKPMRPRTDDASNSPDRPVQAHEPANQSNTEVAVGHVPFTEEEHEFLLVNSKYIVDVDEDNIDDMWAQVAEEFPSHTKEEWHCYFDKEVLPLYRSAGIARNGVSPVGSKRPPDTTQSSSRDGIVRSGRRASPAQHRTSSQSHETNSPVTVRRTPKVARKGSSELQTSSQQGQANQSRVTPSSPLDGRGDKSATPHPSKRKLTELEKGTIGSPSPKDASIHTAKRRRMTAVLVTKEVPSTPESHSRSTAHRMAVTHSGHTDPIDNGDPIAASQTLTEPERYRRKKHCEVQETQMIDLVVPEPVDESESDFDEVNESEPSVTPRPSRQRAVEDTQDEPDSPENDEGAELDQWIDQHVEAGYSEDEVIYALKRTSMDARLAEFVLEHLERGEGLPQNIQGIWTEAEDEMLQGRNKPALRELERRHGLEAFNARLRFMETYENAEVTGVD